MDLQEEIYRIKSVMGIIVEQDDKLWVNQHNIPSGKEYFLNKSKSIFGDKFNYDLVDYKNAGTPVELICTEHNKTFSITPDKHYKSRTGGCPICRKTGKKDTESFIKNVKDKFGDDVMKHYNFSLVDYTTNDKDVKIVCNIPGHKERQKEIEGHEWFTITPNNFLKGKQGCPFCREKTPSIGEAIVKDILDKIGLIKNDDYLLQYSGFKECTNKGVGGKKCQTLTFDFYLPKLNILIEYDGDFHFEQKSYGSNLTDFKSQVANDLLKKQFIDTHPNLRLIRIYYGLNTYEKLFELLKNEINKDDTGMVLLPEGGYPNKGWNSNDIKLDYPEVYEYLVKNGVI
jgi:hypothetical protein